MQLNVLDDLQTKVLILEARLRVVDTEQARVSRATGRILARAVHNFRDSPPMDVSAMDGYACRLVDLKTSSGSPDSIEPSLPVAAVAAAGASPLELSVGSAIRIFTGGVVPHGADVVIPRERCQEGPQSVSVSMPLEQIKLGWNIRRQGENARQGDVGLLAGCLIDGPRMSSLVSMSRESQIEVYRKVRVTIINTGDELLQMDAPIEPWQIRDSNGPLLESMLGACPWIEWTRTRAKDDLGEIESKLAEALQVSDAVIFTGGVSMGDTDHVPAAVKGSGAEVLFHRLAIRPGAPILGAASHAGQLILGLPGNPVSVAVTFRRFGMPLLERLGGRTWGQRHLRAELANGDDKTLHLVWYRLVHFQPDGRVLLLPNQGSGDIRSLGLSDGFVEIPPETHSKGTFRYFDWAVV